MVAKPLPESHPPEREEELEADSMAPFLDEWELNGRVAPVLGVGGSISELCIPSMFPSHRYSANTPFLPVPPIESKEAQDGEMSEQQGQVECSVLESLLWQESPIHRPLEEELAAQVEGAAQVPYRVHEQEGQSQGHLQETPVTCLPRTVGMKMTIQHGVGRTTDRPVDAT